MPDTVNLWDLYSASDIQNWAYFWSTENFFLFYQHCEKLVVESIDLKHDPYVEIRLHGLDDEGEPSTFTKYLYRSDLDEDQRAYLMQIIKEAHSDKTTKGREIRKRSSVALRVPEKKQ
jgi:hypothetical protein